MNSVLLGLAAALSWGVYDFLARFPSRAIGTIPSVLAVTFFGLVALTVWLLAADKDLVIVWPKLWLAAVTGIFFALATLALFAAYARGPIAIVAPIIGSYPAAAMIFAVAEGARPSALQWLAVACVMGGVAVAARSGGHHEESGAYSRDDIRAATGFAALSGAGFAVSIIAGQAAVPVFGDIGAVWLARLFGLLTIGLIFLWQRPSVSAPSRWFLLLALMGCLDVGALVALTAAGNLPSPEFTTVVSSAFGVITVLLARFFLHEQISPLQVGGMMLVFGGVAALAAL